MKETIQNLTSEISRHDYLYYVACAPEISDAMYDAMFEKLLRMEAEYPELADPNSPTSRVGNNTSNSFKKYSHQYPMLSIKSYYDIQTVIASIAKQFAELPASENMFSVEPKLDGIAIELEYRDNKLYRALTRGDGFTGEDITANIRTIKTIPLAIKTSLPMPKVDGPIIIRGEIVVSDANLKAINCLRKKQKLDPLPNNRNAAASLTMSKSSAMLSGYSAYLDACFYETNIGRYHSNNLLDLQRFGFKTLPSISFDSIAELPSVIKCFNPSIYPTDGFVIKINDHVLRSKLGENTRHVNWAFALKERSETIQSPFRYIDYSISSTGLITPVVNFEPIKYNGIIYKCVKVTWDHLRSMNLSIGAILDISIKGSVSAQIIGSSNVSASIELIETCPACKQTLTFSNNTCKCNNSECPEKTGNWQHLQSRYKIFDAGNRFGSMAVLRYAAKAFNAPIVRKVKNSSQTLVFYQSSNDLSQIIFSAAQL